MPSPVRWFSMISNLDPGGFELAEGHFLSAMVAHVHNDRVVTGARPMHGVIDDGVVA